jgi:hypothetical protein
MGQIADRSAVASCGVECGRPGLETRTLTVTDRSRSAKRGPCGPASPPMPTGSPPPALRPRLRARRPTRMSAAPTDPRSAARGPAARAGRSPASRTSRSRSARAAQAAYRSSLASRPIASGRQSARARPTWAVRSVDGRRVGWSKAAMVVLPGRRSVARSAAPGTGPSCADCGGGAPGGPTGSSRKDPGRKYWDARSDEALAHGDGRGLAARVDAEPVEDRGDVPPDGARGEEECLGDLAVGPALRD